MEEKGPRHVIRRLPDLGDHMARAGESWGGGAWKKAQAHCAPLFTNLCDCCVVTSPPPPPSSYLSPSVTRPAIKPQSLITAPRNKQNNSPQHLHLCSVPLERLWDCHCQGDTNTKVSLTCLPHFTISLHLGEHSCIHLSHPIIYLYIFLDFHISFIFFFL